MLHYGESRMVNIHLLRGNGYSYQWTFVCKEDCGQCTIRFRCWTEAAKHLHIDGRQSSGQYLNILLGDLPGALALKLNNLNDRRMLSYKYYQKLARQAFMGYIRGDKV